MSEFLKDLPVHDEDNFSLYDNARASSMKRPSVYLPTIDIPAEQSKWKESSHNQDSSMFEIFCFSHHNWEEEYSSALLTSDMGQEERS